MAFSLEIQFGLLVPLAGMTNFGAVMLTDGNPYWLESAEGLSGAEPARHSQRFPAQDGMTDLGYRLQPRLITLNVHFYATTNAILDQRRQDLVYNFPPFRTLRLKLTRDDGTTRFLYVHAVDEVEIDLVPEHAAAKLHRAVIRLRAADPLWSDEYDTVSATHITQWYRAGGYIGTAQIKQAVENPNNGASWSWVDTNIITGNWAVAVNTAKGTGTGTRYVWDTHSNYVGRFRYANSTGLYSYNDSAGTTWPGGTAANYHIVENRSQVYRWQYWDGTAVATHASHAGTSTPWLTFSGAWRSDNANNSSTYWTPAITRAVVFKDQTDTQLRALAPYIMGSATYGVTAINDGDTRAFPYIHIDGPITNPVLTNLETGGSINLTGLTLGTAEVCILDLRDGNKRVIGVNGDSLLGSVTTLPMNIADFYLAPATEVTDGVNTIAITGGSVGTAAYVFIQWRNRYLSF